MSASQNSTGSVSTESLNDWTAEEALTILEKKILHLIGNWKSSQEISELLGLSIRTVYHHKAEIMNKLNINNYNNLVKYAISAGYAYKES